MLKLLYTLLLLCAVACNAEPLRQRTNTRNRFFARQEAALAPAPTGYPQAGVTPEVPFELPNEQSTTAQPNLSYLPPDNTYGPPDNTYGPPPNESAPPLPPVEEDPENAVDADAEIPQPQPDVKVQPVDAAIDVADDDDVIVEVAEDGSVIAVSTSFDQDAVVNEKPARLVYQRFPQQRRRDQQAPPTSEAFVERRPARLLRLRPIPVAPGKLQQQQPVKVFAYNAQLQRWK